MKRFVHWFGWWHHWRCCPPPPRVTGVTTDAGGGSGEVVVTWDPLPADTHITHYRVYRHKGGGAWWLLAIDDGGSLGIFQPGRLGIVDAPDYWPWPTGADGSSERCYAIAAVSDRGIEGPWSADACGIPL